MKRIWLAFFLIHMLFSEICYSQANLDPVFKGPLAEADQFDYWAIQYYAGNEYEWAAEYGQMALNSAEKIVGSNSFRLNKYLGNLSAYLEGLGEYKKAMTLLEKSEEIIIDKKGKLADELSYTYRMMGITAEKIENYDYANLLFLKAIEIARFRRNHDEIGRTGSELAYLKMCTGELDSAYHYNKIAMSENKDMSSLDSADFNEMFAQIAFYKKDPDDSFNRYFKALHENSFTRTIKSFSSYNNKDTVEWYDVLSIEPLTGLFKSCLLRKDYISAEKYFDFSILLGDKYLNKTLGFKSDNRMEWDFDSGYENFWMKPHFGIQKQIDLAVSYQLHYSDPSDNIRACRALNVILKRKGIILFAQEHNMTALMNYLSPDQRLEMKTINATKSYLSRLKLTNTANPEYLSLWQDVDFKEKALFNSVGNLKEQIEIGFINVAELQKKLPPKSALLEFVLFSPFDLEAKNLLTEWKEPHYAAYLLMADGSVTSSDLGPAAQIDQLIAAIREDLIDPGDNEDLKSDSRNLYNSLLQPFSNYLKDINHVFISPDGMISFVPFGALMDNDGQYMIEKHAISYLSSGRELMDEYPENNSSGIVVFANPVYGATSDLPKNSLIGSILPANQLPLTANIADSIKLVFHEATIFSDSKADAGSFKEINRPQLLFVATHGFAIPKKNHTIFEDEKEPSQSNPAYQRKEDNPLLRCGLLFENANQFDTAAANNGILSGLEITGIDLHGTELVVLAACETGLGDVKAGEGVYGLRRAFSIAGTQSQMISLWSVQDTATVLLINLFNEFIFQKVGKAKALQLAQVELIKKGYSPYYWSAFVLYGDWHALTTLKDKIESKNNSVIKNADSTVPSVKWTFKGKGYIRSIARSGPLLYAGSQSGFLYAIDINSGALKWKINIQTLTELKDTGIYSVSVSDSFLVVSTIQDLLVFNIHTRQLLWKYQSEFGMSVILPLFYKNQVLWGVSDYFISFNLNNGDSVWSVRFTGSPRQDAIIGESLYLATCVWGEKDEGALYRIDIRDGHIINEINLNCWGNQTLAHDDEILLLSTLQNKSSTYGNVKVTIVPLSLQAYNLSEENKSNTHFLICDSVFYGTEEGRLMAFNKKGKLIWQYKPEFTETSMFTSPVKYKDKILFGVNQRQLMTGQESGIIYLYDASTGSVETVEFPGQIAADLFVSDDMIFAPMEDGYVRMLR